MKLLGKTRVNGKQFSTSDSIGLVKRDSLGLEDSFYGGSVKEFYKTDYGIYMCLNKKKEIVNLGYFDHSLTEKGKALLSGKQEIPEEVHVKMPTNEEMEFYVSLNEMTRPELIALAKEKGVEGKLATMKTTELKEKIKQNS